MEAGYHPEIATNERLVRSFHSIGPETAPGPATFMYGRTHSFPALLACIPRHGRAFGALRAMPPRGKTAARRSEE
jgi:hypothetical protein